MARPAGVALPMPHTKHELMELLDSAGITPRHRWGQNFLIDLNLMRLLVDGADIQPNDVVLEVGCGTGSMTSLLVQRAGVVVAVDIDEQLAGIAQQELEHSSNVSFLCCDVLANKNTIEPEVLQRIDQVRQDHQGRLLLVANLPYQIAGPLMIDLLRQHVPVSAMHVTVQAEVADRMIAQPSTKAYGPLSIMLQATGSLNRVRSLGPGAFWPRPQVSSAMISWRRDLTLCQAIQDINALKAVIDLLLGHRRKKIRTCLAAADKAFEQIATTKSSAALLQALEFFGINPDARAETLAPRQFVALANTLTAD